MSDAHALHTALLKPAILHILRASGFHSTRPSVLDTLTDLCARYLVLLGQNTAANVYSRTAHDPPPSASSASNDAAQVNGHDNTFNILTQFELPPTQQSPDAPAPTLTDVRQALDAASFFPLTLTATEEAWAEVLRRPLNSYPAGTSRDKERRKRDLEDTRDVRDFIEWSMGPVNKEIRRIAGMQSESSGSGMMAGPALDPLIATAGSPGKPLLVNGEDHAAGVRASDSRDPAAMLQSELVNGVDGILAAGVGAPGVNGIGRLIKDDYVAVLKKKHSKTGDGARYAGTALGKAADERGPVRIEGGPESLAAWALTVKRKRAEDDEEEGDA